MTRCVFQNAAVAVLLHGNHFSEKVWGDPVTFRPERFLGPNNKIINAEKITPFGYGNTYTKCIFTFLFSNYKRWHTIQIPTLNIFIR
jgi:hypothetical protein